MPWHKVIKVLKGHKMLHIVIRVNVSWAWAVAFSTFQWFISCCWVIQQHRCHLHWVPSLQDTCWIGREKCRAAHTIFVVKCICSSFKNGIDCTDYQPEASLGLTVSGWFGLIQPEYSKMPLMNFPCFSPLIIHMNINNNSVHVIITTMLSKLHLRMEILLLIENTLSI